ncbi:hypothetical protein CDD80_4222 [Ophiocordyceps camponoti-rufipedis]|uniref:Uncharacterized protein n=1 Tax=Ophiocordyceps camponoti-rufipedis TaxID=2004952 RepID=A0A2C5XHS0_9HYPO|nr:hypothetical protein CDD80_4222 [Ophiocordyceps camponoti-rufipedis]
MDSTMSGGNSSSSGAAPHPDPVGDAVPMEDMARHADADEAAPSTPSSDAVDAAPPTASTTDTSKGKDRDPDALSKQRRTQLLRETMAVPSASLRSC